MKQSPFPSPRVGDRQSRAPTHPLPLGGDRSTITCCAPELQSNPTPKELRVSAPGEHGETSPLAQPQVPPETPHKHPGPHQPTPCTYQSNTACQPWRPSFCCPLAPQSPHLVPSPHTPCSPLPRTCIQQAHIPCNSCTHLLMSHLYCTVSTCPVEFCVSKDVFTSSLSPSFSIYLPCVRFFFCLFKISLSCYFPSFTAHLSLHFL